MGEKKSGLLLLQTAFSCLICLLVGNSFYLSFYGTTACEKPLLLIRFCFEHFFYSGARHILFIAV